MKRKNVYVIAGPNGAGKTTFARLFLPEYAHCPNFVNADLIAAGLAPFGPSSAALKAGKLVLQQIHEFAERGVDFAFETTLSGKSYVRLWRELKSKGYGIHLFFLWIPTTELAIGRVQDRVAKGGHDVPVADIKRRFARGIRNFVASYRPVCDSWMLFDNASRTPRLIAKGKNGRTNVVDAQAFNAIQHGTR